MTSPYKLFPDGRVPQPALQCLENERTDGITPTGDKAYADLPVGPGVRFRFSDGV